MKIVVNIKDPDGFSEDVDKAVRESLASIEGIDDEERESLFEARRDKVWGELRKFVRYQECMRVEFDTDSGTAIVLEEGA